MVYMVYRDIYTEKPRIGVRDEFDLGCVCLLRTQISLYQKEQL